MFLRICLIFVWTGLWIATAYAAPVTILATSDTQALLEPCGCAENIEGGLEARAGCLDMARKESPDAILVDLGRFFPPRKQDKKPAFLLPDEDQVNRAVGLIDLEAMRRLGYHAVLPGPVDLEYLDEEARHTLSSSSASNPQPSLVATNVVEAKTGQPVLPVSLIHSTPNGTIAFLGACGLQEGPVTPGGFRVEKTRDSITKTVEQLRQDPAVDAVVLLAHEPPLTVQKWLADYSGPRIDLVIALDAGLTVEKTGETFITNAPAKGRAVGKIVAEVEKGKGIVNVTFERISLDPAVYSHPATREFLTQAYASRVEALGLALPGPAVLMDLREEKESAGYAGAEACVDCHQSQFDQWKSTRHAKAFLSLLDQNRHWVPYCVQCHVTGMNKSGGFKTYPASAKMMNVQCETCHGPGQSHIDEFGTGPIRRGEAKAVCIQCHDAKNSPKFEETFDLYFEQIKH
ncbi:MAG: multiheme c-type cytochrome [bacterium]